MTARTPGSQSLGDALRTWRSRLRPTEVGLAGEGDRRVPGLRRGEVAARAGVSVDYLTRLEQDRAQRPSTHVLDALARALVLDDDARDLLYRLAGYTPPADRRLPTTIPDRVPKLVEQLADSAVAVCTPAWDVIGWNELWRALRWDPAVLHGRPRNLAWRQFTGLETGLLFDDESRRTVERSFVVPLHRAARTYAGDPLLTDLIADLLRTSPAFADLWAEGELLPCHNVAKTVVHPEVGVLTLDSDLVDVVETDLRLVVYHAPPGSAAAVALRRLRPEPNRFLTA